MPKRHSRYARAADKALNPGFQQPQHHPPAGARPLRQRAAGEALRRGAVAGVVVDMAVFHENTEGVYAGLEWQSGSAEVANIMKFTGGAFKEWGYKPAREEFGDFTLNEQELWERHDDRAPEGKLATKDRIADAMFQQVLLRSECAVIATTNFSGDYLSDALVAQITVLGMSPGSPGVVPDRTRPGAGIRRSGRHGIHLTRCSDILATTRESDRMIALTRSRMHPRSRISETAPAL